MSQLPPNLDNAWQGMEPQQPRGGRGGCFALTLAAVVLLGIGVVALAALTFRQRTQPEPGLTLPGDETATPEPVAGATQAAATATLGPNLAATATLPAGTATIAPPPASDVFAGRMAAILDGDPSDWAGFPIYTSNATVFTGDEWDGSDDLTAEWHIGWDDVFLYLVVKVTDDTHVQTQTGNQAFRGDSVELQIDADRGGDYGPSLSPDDFQASLSPGDFGGLPPSAWLFQGTAGGDMLDAPAGHGIVVAARPADTGYVLEAAIPWRDLNVTPAPGLVIGLAVNINDNDRPGTAAQEVMKSNAPGRRFGDPTTWGTLTLQ